MEIHYKQGTNMSYWDQLQECVKLRKVMNIHGACQISMKQGLD